MYSTKCVFVLTLYSMTFYVCLWAAEDADGFHTYSKDEYPNPLDSKDAANCGRSKPSKFCNAQRLLITYKQASQIDEIIHKIANDTGCICEHGCPDNENGLSVGVALLKSAEQYSSNYLNEYADYLRKHWRLGSCENGILILIVVKKGLITVSLGENSYNALGSEIFDEINNRESNNIKNETALFNALDRLLQSYYEKLKSLNLNKDSAKRWKPNVILIVAISFGVICLLICIVGIIYHFSTRKCRKVAKVNSENDPHSNCCYCCFDALCCCL